MKSKIKPNPIRKTVLTIISEHIGVDVKEIKDEDIFTEDLHMRATDLTDIVEKISQKGIDITKIDFEKTTTVGDLIDTLIIEEEF